jgi:subtilisin family serine protease
MSARLSHAAAPASAALAIGLAACAGGDAIPVGHEVPVDPETTSVTLLTGDVVHVERRGGRPVVHVEPGPGRASIAFRHRRFSRPGEEEIHVVPSDAIPLIASGQVDPLLFDVTALIREGLDDRRSDGLPLIVRHAPGDRATASLDSAALASIDASAVVEPRDRAGALWGSLVDGGRKSLGNRATRIWLDRRIQMVLDRSAEQVGAPVAWAAGLTGEGAAVAVLDSGVDATHPDLAAQIREVRDFTGTDSEARDDDGHGTHVAGIIASTGEASGGRYRGVAPGAELLIGKVCTTDGCQISDVIAGMEWAAARARVVNMSLGGEPTDGTDPMALAVDELSARHGTLFVIAAGNRGAHETVSTPGSAAAALTVGSVTKDDALSEFSSRGPRLGDGAVKPEIVAPGSDIVAARAPGTPTGDSEPVDDLHTLLSGTSMATPHVAGAAAILAAAHPDWDGARIKATLVGSATRLPEIPGHAQGAGRLDLGAAIAQTVRAEPATIGFGVVPWPHDADALRRTVTLHNDADQAILLDLVLEVRDASGAPAPAGMFRVETARVAIESHGSAEVVMVAQPAARRAGIFAGVLRASGTGAGAVVPVSLQQGSEAYDLTLQFLHRSGAPAALGDFTAYDPEERTTVWVTRALDGEGRMTLRLPRARYMTVGTVFEDDEVGTGSKSEFPDPELDLDRDTSLVLDARQAQQLRVSVEAPRATITDTSMETAIIQGRAMLGFGWGVTGEHTLSIAPTRPMAHQRVHFMAGFGLEAPSSGAAPVRYNLAMLSEDGIPDRLAYTVRDRDLARVETTYRGQGAASTAHRTFVPFSPRGFVSTFPLYWPVALPTTQTLFFTVDDRFAWSTKLEQSASGRVEVLRGNRSYRRGLQAEQWNRAAVGPALTVDEDDLVAVHWGTSIIVDVPLFSPGEPGHVTQTSGIERTTSLWRDGELVGTEPNVAAYFSVPPERASYRLQMTARREVPWSVLDTEVDASWTFVSEEPAGVRPAPLPLLAVKIDGATDADSAAPAGQPYLVALRVERQFGAPTPPLTELGLEVSFDDGASWRRAPVLRMGSQAIALVWHPAAPGPVSLRTRAADADGNTLQQTVLRSYRTR